MPRPAVDFVLGLHSHLPYVLNHGRWPHGSDWICEAAIDTYLPLLEALEKLRHEGVPAPVTLGITPILANQLASPVFVEELEAYFAQRLASCDEAAASLDRRPAPDSSRRFLEGATQPASRAVPFTWW
jgi:1,4-alpha-glucan branching enzyme